MQPPADNTAPEAQRVLAPLTTAAIFLVVTIRPGADGDAALRAMGEDIGGLVRSIGFRDLEGQLSCVVGIGSDAWDRIVAPAPPGSRPQGLHPFRSIESAGRVAPSTPGDLLFHIRATRFDLCFELAATILRRLGPHVASADEVHGFRYFEARDLLGFVDGTENPTGDAMAEAALIGEEDPDYTGGSYVIVQKYLHDLDAWNALSVEEQERVIGRTKLEDIEFDDDVKPANAHIAFERDRGGRHRDRHPPRQHAVRFGRVRGVRHLFHRLRPGPRDDRGDAAEHVRRQPRGQLRRHLGLLDGAHRVVVLRAVPAAARKPVGHRRGGRG